MEVAKILKNVIGEHASLITEIVGFGSVNKVFAIKGTKNDYVIRLNKDKNIELEYLKEEWCLKHVKSLGIPVPDVLKIGVHGEYSYMLQAKIAGVNGSTCAPAEKLEIWNHLGKYTARFNVISQITVPAVQEAEFHDNWQSKIAYNITELHTEDPLLASGVFTIKEQQRLKEWLLSLRTEDFKMGLTHGDLSPRNVIIDHSTVHLLDWGTAEINIVPYAEIGMVLMEGEANEAEFNAFLSGMGIGAKAYQEMKPTIQKINVLHRLDKYRWALDNDQGNINDFMKKLKQAYSENITSANS